MKNKYRIHKCKDTQHQVIQIQEDSGNWLCLHSNNESLDKKTNLLIDETAVYGFKCGRGDFDKPSNT